MRRDTGRVETYKETYKNGNVEENQGAGDEKIAVQGQMPQVQGEVQQMGLEAGDWMVGSGEEEKKKRVEESSAMGRLQLPPPGLQVWW